LPVSVDFSTADGSAVAGVDYMATNGTLTFAPGVTTQTVSVTVIGDLTDEANENFFLNLSNAVNVTLTDTQGKATILDDDPLVLSIPDISVLEGYTGTSEARFTVNLSKPMRVPVSVDFATANGTALAGSDYVATNGTITFLPGETNHLIVVAVIGDALDELNESFFVNLTNPLNVTLTDTQARATIVDDDDAMISISDATVRESQTGQTPAIFTVSLSTMSTRTVSVRASTANGTATAGTDYIAFSGLLVSFPPGTTHQSVVVQVLGDTVTEPNETFQVNLTSAFNGFIAHAQGIGTILQDHPPLAVARVFALFQDSSNHTNLLVLSANGTNATVLADGSLSSDPDNDPLQYSWFELGDTNALATGVVGTNVLTVGSHTILLVVSDGILADTNAVSVEVITTAQAVERLQAAANSDAARSQPLIAALSAAIASIDRSNPTAAINQLLAFQNQVRAQVTPIDPALAATFIEAAQEVIDVFSGGNTNPAGRPHARFTSVNRQSNGRVQMQFSAEPGQLHVMEASSNLSDWEMIGVGSVLGDGSYEFEDKQAARFGQRFYRVRVLP